MFEKVRVTVRGVSYYGLDQKLKRFAKSYNIDLFTSRGFWYLKKYVRKDAKNVHNNMLLLTLWLTIPICRVLLIFFFLIFGKNNGRTDDFLVAPNEISSSARLIIMSKRRILILCLWKFILDPSCLSIDGKCFTEDDVCICSSAKNQIIGKRFSKHSAFQRETIDVNYF